MYTTRGLRVQSATLAHLRLPRLGLLDPLVLRVPSDPHTYAESVSPMYVPQDERDRTRALVVVLTLRAWMLLRRTVQL
jgi:hypothetical protein